MIKLFYKIKKMLFYYNNFNHKINKKLFNKINNKLFYKIFNKLFYNNKNKLFN